MTFPILGGNSAVTGAYSIDNSLRFNDDDSAKLSRTPSSSGNRKTWTWSAWVKRSTIGTQQKFFVAGTDDSNRTMLYFETDNTLRVYFRASGINYGRGSGDAVGQVSTAIFRDVSAWYHILVSVDLTASDASSPLRADANRLKFYVNGIQQTNDTSHTFANFSLTQNTDTLVNHTNEHSIGLQGNDNTGDFDGYLAETYLIDGTAKAPTDFGEFDSDSGIWKPKQYSGSYGTNGFYLPFNNIGQTHNITAYGDVHHETDEQKIGATSIEFDGTGDYLSLDDKSQFKFGNGDFTIEFFAKMGDQANTYTTLFNDPSGGNKLRVDTGGSTTAPVLSFYSSAWDERTSGTTDLSDNAWHHCAIVRDNGTLRIFVDGTQEATRASSTQDVDSSGVFEIGRYNGGTRYFDGYLDEIRISNVARYTGSFTPTTSAFTSDANTRLLIHSNSSDGNTTFTDDSGSDGGIGDDASGNNNDFTTTNISDYTDQTTDTPTNNFATLNPLAFGDNTGTLSEGNLNHTNSGGDSDVVSTIGISTGKFYAEFKAETVVSGRPAIAVYNDYDNGSTTYGNVNGSVLFLQDGRILVNNSSIGDFGSISQNDIIQVAIDNDNGAIYIGQNGSYLNSGNPTSGSSRTGSVSNFTAGSVSCFMGARANSGSVVSANFGNPAFSITSGNNDDNGYGNFEYAPPSGYLALCTQNLATELSPTIDDGSAYFHTQLYTGNRSSSQTITNDANAGDFQPDWLWIKPRDDTVGHSHSLFDSTRGVTKGLASNLSEAEYTTTSKVTSFNTDGFSIGNGASVNQPDRDVNYVTWQWKANGGTTSSNTDGSITSTVQANQTAGFSIVTWTGTEASATVGHGLGKRPECIIVKTRGGDENWVVRFRDTITGNAFHKLHLNNTNTIAQDFTLGNMQDTTSSVFYLQNSGQENDSGQPMIAYCFAPIEGYSKFGSYTGNGSTDGTFVYTGFRPAWVMVKNTTQTSAGAAWHILDAKRDSFNEMSNELAANATASENGVDGGVKLDFLSNGFKLSGNTYHNYSGGTHIYMCFASNPFVSSSGVPVTAR